MTPTERFPVMPNCGNYVRREVVNTLQMWHTCWGASKKLLELCNKIIFILNYLFLIKEIKRKQIGHFLSCKITLRRRNLEESIHNENHWPQLLHVSDVECQIDHFACFSAYFLSFPKENTFQNLEENLWTINWKTEFPHFSLTLTISKIFPDT